MRFWFSMPFIRRTRIGISVSDREIARAFHAKPVTEDEQKQHAAKEAEIEARAQAFAKRWTPFVNWFIVTAFVVVVVDLIIWSLFKILN